MQYVPPCIWAETQVKIVCSVEESAEEYLCKEFNVQLFTDNSGLDSKVGAASVMYKEGQDPKTLRHSIGPLTEYTVFKLEVIGEICNVADYTPTYTSYYYYVVIVLSILIITTM